MSPKWIPSLVFCLFIQTLCQICAKAEVQARKQTVAAPQPAPPILTPSQIAQKAFPSVVLLTKEDNYRQPISLGSGFFITDDLVATNLHVIEGAAKGHAKIIGKNDTFEIASVFALEEPDLALVKLAGAKAAALKIGTREVAIGDEVYAIGNPRGLEGTFSQGIVSGIRNLGELKIIQITAPISPGSSGGPVLNAYGEVVGIATATLTEGQNLNFAIPVAHISHALKYLQRLDFQPLPISGISQPHGTILGDSSKRVVDAVKGETILWRGFTNEYSFSLHNLLHAPISDIYCIVIFHGSILSQVDTEVLFVQDIIPGGLAKRISGVVDSSVRNLNTPIPENPIMKEITSIDEYNRAMSRYLKVRDGYSPPLYWVEIRVLDFRIVR
jgi:hypothetical protein